MNIGWEIVEIDATLSDPSEEEMRLFYYLCCDDTPRLSKFIYDVEQLDPMWTLRNKEWTEAHYLDQKRMSERRKYYLIKNDQLRAMLLFSWRIDDYHLLPPYFRSLHEISPQILDILRSKKRALIRKIISGNTLIQNAKDRYELRWLLRTWNAMWKPDSY